MEGLLTLTGIILIIFGVLQIILFFKMWGMTDDVKILKKQYLDKSENMQSSIDKLSYIIKDALIPKAEELDTKKEVHTIERKNEAKHDEPVIYRKEFPIIDENSDEFKQRLRKWKVLKSKGYTDQAIKEYITYTELDYDSAITFINNL